MAVYKRRDTKSKRWFYKFDIGGICYKQNIPTARTKRQAEEAERKARQDVHEGKYSTVRPMRFVDFVKEHYLPWAEKHHAENDTDKTQTDLLCAYFKGYSLTQVSPMAIEGFKLKQSKAVSQFGRVFSPGTVNLALSHLSGIMSMAIRYNLIQKNPCRGIKRLPIPAKRPRHLSGEEEAILMEALDTCPSPWLKDLVQFAIWTGFRQQEIINLRREHVDFAHDRIFVVETKWKKDPRKTEGFPMSAAVRDLVSRLCVSDYLFNFKGRKLTKPGVDIAFRRLRYGLGLRDLNFHALRHTFGTRLGERDVNLKKIARLMGHATTKHTEIYVHTTDAGLSDAVEIASQPSQVRTRSDRIKAVSSL